MNLIAAVRHETISDLNYINFCPINLFPLPSRFRIVPNEEQYQTVFSPNDIVIKQPFHQIIVKKTDHKKLIADDREKKWNFGHLLFL